MITVDEFTFNKELSQNELPVLVDFSAIWCGPCKKQSEILIELSNLKKDTLKVLKVDVDDCPNLASKFGIRNLPTLILFRNGQLTGKKIGLTSLNSLLELVK